MKITSLLSNLIWNPRILTGKLTRIIEKKYKKTQMILQLGLTNRVYNNSNEGISSTMFFFGLKTAIVNRYFDI